MPEYVTDRFEDSYPDDEVPPVETWECVKCHKKLVDPDDCPWAHMYAYKIEAKDHWLGPTEPVCHSCAVAAGIPSIDEEEDA